jgi:hypothetical protein
VNEYADDEEQQKPQGDRREDEQHFELVHDGPLNESMTSRAARRATCLWPAERPSG